MADIFEFMMGKKKNKPKNDNSEKTNFSIFMPVGVYDGGTTEDGEFNYEDAGSYKGWNTKEKVTQEENGNRRGEYNAYSVDNMKFEEQLMELKRHISDYEDNVNKLKDTIIDLQNENSELAVERSRYEYIAATYRAMIEKIVKIMPYYQEIEFTGIGTPEEWKDRQLVEVFVTCVEKIKLSLADALELSKKVQSYSVENSNNMPQPDISSPSNDDFGIELPDIPNLDDMGEFPSVDIPDLSVIDMNANSNFMNEEISAYLEKVNGDEQLKVVLEVIGETGLARISDLKETDKFKITFVDSNGKFAPGPLSKKVRILEDLSVLETEKINTGRKGGIENLYALSSVGVALYSALFGAKAVESEKESIRKQHTSLEHGYFIKTLAKELEAKGYEVFDSPEDCVRKPLISNKEGDHNLRVEADLIIKKGDEEYIVECEMGTTCDADMNKKLDKLILVTNTISFVMNNQESMNSTIEKVDKWISKTGRDNLKGYMFRFSTIDTLKKREIWQNKGPF